MLLVDLKSMAGGMGIAGAGSMKKVQLVEAIKGAQGAASSAPAKAVKPAKLAKPASEPKSAPALGESSAPATEKSAPAVVKTTRTRGGASRRTQSRPDAQVESEPDARSESTPKSMAESLPESTPKSMPESAPDTEASSEGRDQGNRTDSGDQPGETSGRQRTRNRQANPQGGQRDKSEQGTETKPEQRQTSPQEKQTPEQNPNRAQQSNQQAGAQQNNQQQNSPQQNTQQQNNQDDLDDDGEGGSRRNRRRRGRDRDRDRQGVRVVGGRNEPDTTVLEDDVLVPAAGILDVLDNYAFVRTSGYLPGTDDVYLSLSMVRKFGLRRGDAVVGQVRQPREGERKEKFNPMVRIDSINGTDPEAARERVEFETFTPVHPTDRLRLETDATNLTGRVIDIAAPIGKGQRGMIVAPPKSGRTTLLQSIAQSVSRNNPDVHLMVVLLDARPEEVTDFQRAVKGEVIASTFDRPASDHTMVAELATERAKRLVELGHDVVVLLDSLTSLARAYNVSAPASGRTLAGGVDASAVHPPKQLFGAARNVEGGGSLTVLATVLVETGSATDEVIFEELGGTANMELRLRRELARVHTFPAVDIVSSGTRQEALLTSEQESRIVQAIRSRMASDPVAAVPALLEQLGKAQNNIEFLTKQQKSG